MLDPYKTLEIDRSASESEIKKAYRKKAAEHHPDKGGDEAKFKDVNEAYQILSNSEKKKMYDQFGTTDPQQAGFHSGSFGRNGEHVFENVGDLFEEFFGGGFASSFRNRPLRNKDIKLSLTCRLEDVYNQEEKLLSIDLPSGKRKVTLTLPANAETGTIIRLRGLGDHSIKDLEPGNLMVHLNLLEHDIYQKKGYDLHQEYPINILNILVGCHIELDHISTTKISWTLPEASQPTQTVRFKSKGMPKPNGSFGDLYVTLKPFTPKGLNNKVLTELRKMV
jgi:curved DNA-binding protein